MLTDKESRAAKATGKLYKFGAGAGLQLWVHPNGTKSWRVIYRDAGKERSRTIGHYPAMGLREAREVCQAVKLTKNRRVQPQAPTFGSIKAEWLALMERQGKADETFARARRMARYSAALDKMAIDEIRAPDLLTLLRPIEASGRRETARRLRAMLSSVFRLAAASGYVEADPASLIGRALAAPQTAHRAAMTDSASFSRLMRAIDACEARNGVREALLLLAYTAARPGEVRLTTWGEFDLDAGVWTIPAGRMKMRREHRAPLARQALKLLLELKEMAASFNLLFPGQRPGRPLSENAFNVALRGMGFGKDEVTAHGFRASFSTLANQSGLWSPDAIERHLAHVEKDATRRAYNRADFWDERVRMAQWWADEIEKVIGDD